jgi:hypothetical protein
LSPGNRHVSIYTDQQMTPNLFASDDANSDFSYPSARHAGDHRHALLCADGRPAGAGRDAQSAARSRPASTSDLFVSVDIKVMQVEPTGNYQLVDTADKNGL